MTKRLLSLNGIAVLGVVLNHSVAWGFVAMFWWTHRYRAVSVPNFDQLGSFSYFSLRTVEQIITFSIPAFLFVSGFFVAFQVKRSANNIDRTFLVNRLRTLWIPYLLWSLIMFGADFAQGTVFTANEYVRKLLVGGASPAFYFVPLISQLYLLSPGLALFLEKRWKALLLTVLVVQSMVQVLEYGLLVESLIPVNDLTRILTAGWFFPSHWFWFVLGMVAGYHMDRFKAFTRRMRWWFLAAAGLMLLLGIFEWEFILALRGGEWLTPKETFVDNLYSAALLLAFFGFSAVRLPLNKWLGDVGAKSYGIYLSHSLVLILTAKTIYHLAPRLLEFQLLLQPVLIAVGLGLPILAMNLLKASPARNFYSYVFG